MRPKTLLVVVALAVAFMFSVPKTFAENLLTNGSFETGDFTGWTTGGNFEDTEVVTGPFGPYSGAQDGLWYAVLGPIGSDGTLSQTISDIAGAHYNVSFWFASDNDRPSDFSVMWDGTTLLALTNPNTGFVFTQFSFNVTGTGTDTLQFAFRDDAAFMALDNVSVSPVTGSTPEPSSILLLGTGVVALGGMARRKLGK